MNLARPGSVRTVDDMLERIHAAPAPVPVGSTGIVGDVSLRVFNAAIGASANLIDLKMPLRGLGFTGRLPPGAMLLVAPLEQRALLAEIVNRVSGSSNKLLDFSRMLFSPLANYTALVSPVTPPIVMLAPGDTVAFPSTLAAGVTVAPVTPWYGRTDLGTSPDPCVVSLQDPTSITQWSGYEPTPAPMVRLFGGAVPDRVSFTRAPSTHLCLVGATNQTDGVYCAGAGSVAVTFCDDAYQLTPPPAPIQGAETGAYEVWWMSGDGVWHHNDSDDFDAAGRGAVTRTHDIETYVAPSWAAAIGIVKVSGNDFAPYVTLGWGDR